MAFRPGVGHVLFRGRHPQFTPEDRPFVVDKDLRPEVTFTFIDVIPGLIRPHEYHNFRALVQEANIWLAENNQWEVINCETVLLFFKQSDNGQLHLAPEDTCFPLDGDAHQSLMGLRLWIMRREEPITRQVLKYVDFTPRPDTDDARVRFRKLDLVLERVNREIREGKVDRKLGDIVTIETLYHPVENSEWKIDEKNSSHLFPSRCISIVRIFYFESSEKVLASNFPTIGMRDFVPKQISGGGFFKRPVFEPFSEVLSRASDWISQNPELIFKNAQCLEVKMKTMGRVDTKIMSHSADRGDYLRIFRVSYIETSRPSSQSIKSKNKDTNQESKNVISGSEIKSSSNDQDSGITESKEGENGSLDNVSKEVDEDESSNPRPMFISSIIFTPADQDATVQEIRRRIHEWVVLATRGECVLNRRSIVRTNVTWNTEVEEAEGSNSTPVKSSRTVLGAPRILSAETVEIFTKDFTEDEIRTETENTFKPNRIGTMNQFLFMAFRIYFDVGFFGRSNRSKSICSTVGSTFHPKHKPSSSCDVM